MGIDRRSAHDGNPDPAPDRRLDATGLLCPEPVLRARGLLDGMEAGAVLEILTDDPLAELDFRVFCDRTGHALVSSRESDGVLRTRIRRRPA